MSKAWWKVRLWLVPTRNWGGTQVATRGKVVQGRRQPTSPFFLYCLSMALARARGACSTYERPSPSVYWHSLLRQPIFSLFDINGVSILPVHAQSNWALVDTEGTGFSFFLHIIALILQLFRKGILLSISLIRNPSCISADCLQWYFETVATFGGFPFSLFLWPRTPPALSAVTCCHNKTTRQNNFQSNDQTECF